MIINAEKIKIKGVSLFKEILNTYDEVVINFRGENKYIVIELHRYLELEDYQNKKICREEKPQFRPKKFTLNYLKKLEEKTYKYEEKINKMAIKKRVPKTSIQATELKKKGITIFKDLLKTDDVIVIDVRGVNKYILLDIQRYKTLLFLEQNFMYEKAISEEENLNIKLSENDDIDKFIKSLY